LGTILYKRLGAEDVTLGLLDGFHRYQEVKRCWRKENGAWVLKDVPFTEEWDGQELAHLTQELAHTVASGGAVLAALENGVVAGFASVENEPLGTQGQYLQLSNIHVSFEHRGRGIGKTLFFMACQEARELGAKKLYISAHSAEETQAYYKAMGCTEALEYDPRLTEAEPCDCQLEFVL
jgi:ribosomal protein S18 acetylase RimI-like enzyme